MKILAPVDGSDCSFRALRFATDLANRFEAPLHVIHITDSKGEDTKRILEKASDILEEKGISDEPEVKIDFHLAEPRYANRVGEAILELVEEEGYDHVVMGHHGSGRIQRALLGSATDTVVRSDEVPVTIIP
ncbi:MAG: universal stress protein [Halobacteria archaeon]|nr:universal stress protein [Halobacteria archaeon]